MSIATSIVFVQDYVAVPVTGAGIGAGIGAGASYLSAGAVNPLWAGIGAGVGAVAGAAAQIWKKDEVLEQRRKALLQAAVAAPAATAAAPAAPAEAA